MTLVGFTRLGADNDSDASWLVPPSLTSADLQADIDLIRKYEFDPLTYEDGKGPEDMLRSKTATERRAAPRVEFDDDSDGIDGDKEDRGEYAADGPTARKPAGIRKKLTRRTRERTAVELDDEEQDARAEARRTKEAEKQRKIKSTMFVHDSDDDDWDVDKEKEFYERENEIREFTMAQFKKSMGLTVDEPTSSKKTKKRKADGEEKKEKKRRKTPPKRRAGPFDASDSGDEDVHGEGSEADSEARKDVDIDSEEEDEATDTPLSSQHAAATRASDGESRLKTTSETTATKQDVVMVDDEDEDEDEDGDEDENEDEAEDDGPVTRRPAARTRAGFVIESDSDE
jgi:replication fork protection complex subunit Tof1/Swi1